MTYHQARLDDLAFGQRPGSASAPRIGAVPAPPHQLGRRSGPDDGCCPVRRPSRARRLRLTARRHPGRRPLRWSGSALLVAALVSLPFNAPDDRVLLSVPLGLAWLALGISWAMRNKVPQAA